MISDKEQDKKSKESGDPQPGINDEENKKKLTQNEGEGGKMGELYENNKNKFSKDNPGEKKEKSEHEP